MFVIRGEQQILDKLRKLESGARQWHKKPLNIGYSAEYAIFVHEDMEAVHAIGNAKFLTGPFNRLLPVLRTEARRLIRNGRTPLQAFMEVSQILVDASQDECPVDKGNLKASIFVKQGNVNTSNILIGGT